MAFTRWDPLQDLLALHERINRLTGDEPGWMPPVDLFETGDAYVVTAELPGLARDDIQIQVQDGKVTLKGQRAGRAESCEQYHRVERGHGQFSRTFSLPLPLDVEAIQADFEAGVLTLRIPKADAVRHRRIEIR